MENNEKWLNDLKEKIQQNKDEIMTFVEMVFDDIISEIENHQMKKLNAIKQPKQKMMVFGLKHNFYNTVTGTYEIGVTQSEMCKKYGLKSGGVSLLVNGKKPSHKDWVILKNKMGQ